MNEHKGNLQLVTPLFRSGDLGTKVLVDMRGVTDDDRPGFISAAKCRAENLTPPQPLEIQFHTRNGDKLESAYSIVIDGLTEDGYVFIARLQDGKYDNGLIPSDMGAGELTIGDEYIVVMMTGSDNQTHTKIGDRISPEVLALPIPEKGALEAELDDGTVFELGIAGLVIDETDGTYTFQGVDHQGSYRQGQIGPEEVAIIVQEIDSPIAVGAKLMFIETKTGPDDYDLRVRRL